MDTPGTFGDFLRERARRLALVNEQGAADAGRLAEYLAGRRVRCTKRSVESWFFGERAPRIGRMELVMDALDVYGEERLQAYRLAARVEQDDPHDPPSGLDDPLTVPDFPTPVP